MKRLTLLCLAADRGDALEALRDLAVVHVTDVQPPGGEALDALRARLADARRAAAALSAADPGADAAVPPQARAAQEVVADALEAQGRRTRLEETSAILRRELARYEAFGEFDLASVRRLTTGGVTCVLGLAPAAAQPAPPEGVVLSVVGRDKEYLYFTLISRREWEEPPDLGVEYELVLWPERPLEELRADLDASEAERRELDVRLSTLAAEQPVLPPYLAKVEDDVRLAEVRAGMGVAEHVAFLTGYVPVGHCDAVRSAAAEHGWGVVFADPRRDEDVPTLLHQARWVTPVRTVFDFLNIYPGYWEDDVGWVFLPFFSLFFAMIVGDAGYAVLLLLLTFFLQRRLRRAPAHVFHMMYIAGFATLAWGVLQGSYFGVPRLPGFLTALEVQWVQDRDNLIDLCFLIGAVHLTIAHVWNATTLVRDRRWSKLPAQAGWLLVVWSMFFLARLTVLDRSVPSFLLYLLVAGILLVAIFMKTPREFREEWIEHALLPLTMIGNFVDILSYIRLFAVGFASVAVLAAFNDMAASIGFDSPLAAAAAVVLLVFANALNIVLAGLGVLVHAVRLNTLEFSTHKGLAWEGHNLYTPFKSRAPLP